MKTAVVYDKWLHSLGGGEVVACTIATTLKEMGYKVLFISGKQASKERISTNLNIDVSDIEFTQIWNDEVAIKKIVQGKDLFINVSFMDYTKGFAKKNFYYTHFPTKPYENLRGMIFTKLIIPIATKLIYPFESVNLIDAPIILHDNPAYLLGDNNRYALSSLEINKPREIEFKIFIENFDKQVLRNINIVLQNAEILEKTIMVEHHLNILKYHIKFIPKSSTIYLNLNLQQNQYEDYDLEKGGVYLLYPKIQLRKITNFIPGNILNIINNRLRAGIYINIVERLYSYQKILANSFFTQKWINNYWQRKAIILSPPVLMLNKKFNLEKIKKRNWICSVGRFFTLGHGKKQEILIEAFKNLYDSSKNNWELHLVGGLGDEPSSIDFFKYLKEMIKGYPIYFHINARREVVEKVYLRSKIYWHATGFGEDVQYQPIRFEHFGISPIEALSAKCIPILFNGGGLPEIIQTIGLSPIKNLFNSIKELVKNTEFYQNPKNQEVDWKNIFSQIEKNYSVEAFKKNLQNLISNP